MNKDLLEGIVHFAMSPSHMLWICNIPWRNCVQVAESNGLSDTVTYMAYLGSCRNLKSKLHAKAVFSKLKEHADKPALASAYVLMLLWQHLYWSLLLCFERYVGRECEFSYDKRIWRLTNMVGTGYVDICIESTGKQVYYFVLPLLSKACQS